MNRIQNFRGIAPSLIWGLKLGPKRGVKFEVFDRNNLYIDFNIFGDAESESAIIFHVRPIRGLKWAPKGG